MRKYGGAIISGNIIQWKRGVYLASYKVARKAGPRRQEEDRYNGPPAWQRSPQSLCYVILYTCFLLSLSLSLPPFRSNFFFSSDQVHTARRTPPTSRGQLFISNSRAGPAKGTRRSAGGKKTMAWAVEQFSRESTKD